MPEIAEVETFRYQLEPLLVGQSITSFTSSHPRSTRRHDSSQEVSNAVVGKSIISVNRHGKYLAIVFDDDTHLNIHLRMSGRLIVSDINEYDELNNPKHSHVVFSTDKHVFVFIDPRTFGEIWVTSGVTKESLKGIDALNSTSDEITDVLKECSKSKRMLKAFLLDQNFLSGIGNIYADEICFEAKIRPDALLNSLSEKEMKVVAVAVGKIINRACELRGSSLRDESFRDLYGEIGSYQKEHQVHAKAGEKCICGSEILKIKVASRTTYFCENCQKFPERLKKL